MKIFKLFVFLFIINISNVLANFCIPNPTNGINGYSISQIHLQSLNISAIGTSTYKYFRDSINYLTCYLKPGSSYKLFITSGAQIGSTGAAWIDWNNDSTFNNQSEKLGEFTTVSANQIDSILFIVPLNCNKSKLRLRIRCSNSVSINSCTNYTSGQTADFTLTALNNFYENNFYNGWEFSRCDSGIINGVKLGSINNQNTGTVNGPVYNDYTYLTANISACNSQNLIITSNISPINNNNRLWAMIDFNNNGIFEDMTGMYNEYIGEVTNLSGLRTDTIVVNAPNIPGPHRLRIIASHNGKIMEVEDYSVNITSSGTITIPKAFFTTDLIYACPSGCQFEGCAGQHSFSDKSCGVPASWHWLVKKSGVPYDSSTSQNPTFNFTSGSYDIKLTVSNNSGSDNITKNILISNPNTNFNLGNDTLACSSGSFHLSGPINQCYIYKWNTGQTDSLIYIHSTGTYNLRVMNCDHSGCPAVDSIAVTLSPSFYNVTGGGNYCSGGTGLSVGLDDTQTGISYRLYRNNSPIGTAITGTGNSISFGNQTAAGTYTVVATNNAISCSTSMNGNAAIIVDPLPSPYTMTGTGPYCANTSGSILGLSNSQPGIRYELLRNGNPTGVTINGNGSSVNFPVQSVVGAYTIKAVDTITQCNSTMNGSVTVSITPLPLVFNVIGGGAYCAGLGGVIVGLNSSQTGASYNLFRNGSAIGNTMNGTGSAINFGSQTLAGTYTIVATSQSCTTSMNDTAIISVNPTPAAYNVLGGGHYCFNGPGSPILLSSSDPGIQYQLYNNGVPVGNTLPGNGIIINFGNQVLPGIYTVFATDITTSCHSNMSGNATITIDSLPHVQLLTNLPSMVCIYDPFIIMGGSPPGGTFSGSGVINNIFDPSQAVEGLDTIVYSYADPVNGCIATDSDTVIVDLCTGIIENYFDDGIVIYPNPANDKLYIDIKNLNKDLFSIEILDCSARIIKSIDAVLENRSANYFFGTFELADGIYFVKFNFRKEVLTKKIIITH